VTLLARTVVPQRTLSKVRVLLEALPYMSEHLGRDVVIKAGGAALAEPHLLEAFADDLAILRKVGVRPVVVHGGGPQISALSERLGLTPRFEDGLRVTDADTLEVAKMVLVGKLNKDIVGRINRSGVPAVGLSGDDGDLLLARKRPGPNGRDLGFVGEIIGVNVPLLRTVMEAAVPVIASTGTDHQGQSYNVNADHAAAAVAGALSASKFVLLTDVPGVMRDEELVSELSAGDAQRLVAGDEVTGGMVPKLEAVVGAIRDGVERAHIIDGRVEHCLILELFTPEGLGTMVTRDVAVPS
jgi:acetylglutamate kinase